jgi:hypothetical protein
MAPLIQLLNFCHVNLGRFYPREGVQASKISNTMLQSSLWDPLPSRTASRIRWNTAARGPTTMFATTDSSTVGGGRVGGTFSAASGQRNRSAGQVLP